MFSTRRGVRRISLLGDLGSSLMISPGTCSPPPLCNDCDGEDTVLSGALPI